MAAVAVIAAFVLLLATSTRPAAFAVGDATNGGNQAAASEGFKALGDLVAGDTLDEGSATVLVYLNGSDLESEAGEATADITEMLKSGAGENVNVVIETLGTRKWQKYGIASDHTQRYRVNQGQLELVDDSLGQLDTTSPDTLSDFISWGASNYPADRYFLVMWDHGAGPVYGFGYDEFQSDYSALTLDEIQQALAENSDVHFDIIGMDCCIMSSLETCYVLEPYCDYTVLSEDFEPGIGWSYEGWLGMLENNPTVDTEELGAAIVDEMVADVEQDPTNGDATLALIDESAIDELYAAWIEFAYASEDELLGTNYSQETEWRVRPGQQAEGFDRAPSGHGGPGMGGNSYGMGMGGGMGGNSHGISDSYGMGDSYDEFDLINELMSDSGMWDYWDMDASYVTMTDYFVTDIGEVASSVDSEEANALLSATANAIVHYQATDGEAGMSGLGVTLPYGDAEFYDQLVDAFTACGIDAEYVSWLESFVSAEGVDNHYEFDGGTGFDGFPNGFGLGDSYGDELYGYESGSGHGDGAYGYGYGNGGAPGSGHGGNSASGSRASSWPELRTVTFVES